MFDWLFPKPAAPIFRKQPHWSRIWPQRQPTASQAARALSLHSHTIKRNRIRAKAREMRAELGLPESEALR